MSDVMVWWGVKDTAQVILSDSNYESLISQQVKCRNV